MDLYGVAPYKPELSSHGELTLLDGLPQINPSSYYQPGSTPYWPTVLILSMVRKSPTPRVVCPPPLGRFTRD